MNISFQVVPSMAPTEPTTAYFTGLAQKAREVLQAGQVNLASAWSLCEYLDCVDAGDLLMDKAVYRQCVDLLGGFLASHTNRRNVESLAAKSWAAATLLELVDQQEQDDTNVVQLKGRRLRVA